MAKNPISDRIWKLNRGEQKEKDSGGLKEDIYLAEDEDVVSNKDGSNTGRWTSTEHKILLDALAKFGRKCASILRHAAPAKHAHMLKSIFQN